MRALLDDQRAVHVGFAEFELGIAQQRPFGGAGGETDRDRLAGAVTEGEGAAARGGDPEVPAANKVRRSNNPKQPVHRPPTPQSIARAEQRPIRGTVECTNLIKVPGRQTMPHILSGCCHDAWLSTPRIWSMRAACAWRGTDGNRSCRTLAIKMSRLWAGAVLLLAERSLGRAAQSARAPACAPGQPTTAGQDSPPRYSPPIAALATENARLRPVASARAACSGWKASCASITRRAAKRGRDRRLSQCDGCRRGAARQDRAAATRIAKPDGETAPEAR